ncbi:right-handed parallel beta-helix repeat-containing protein [bacterium]|nr:right-handed parallel beta-helix repeat-containing protein [bacterium]
MRKPFVSISAALALTAALLQGETFTVRSTADAGDGSLRHALTLANDHAGADTIRFEIAENDSGFDGSVWWIQPLSPLPAITGDSLWIDGASQDSSSGNTNPHGPDIVIDGGAQSGEGIGFLVYGGDVAISGLVISGFSDYGIRFRGATCQGGRVQGNYIGTDPEGSASRSNGTGVYISREAGSVLVGGADPSLRNIISGNYGNGVYTTSSRGNVIIGNFIGTDRTGFASVPNALDGKSNGIELGTYSTHNTVGGIGAGYRNIISGNGRDGIHISYSDSNVVIGNYIGTDVSGLGGLANSVSGVGDGIDIRYGSRGNRIGGAGAGEGNVICNSANVGVRLHRQAEHTVIMGNLIGTDASGTIAMANHNQGVYIYDGCHHNVVGGAGPGAGNVISGNTGCGVELYQLGTDSNRVSGNIIGLSADCSSPVPNLIHGVLLHDSTGASVIGPGNIIAGNDSCGIAVANRADGNTVSGNFIGMLPDTVTCFPNGGDGIRFTAACAVRSQMIGPGNVIAGNGGRGIAIIDSTASGITITGNTIFDNMLGGINVAEKANGGVTPPLLSGQDPLSGSAAPGATIEVYSDSGSQGRFYEGHTLAGVSGGWVYTGSLRGPHITATATDDSGNTSAFSAWAVVSVDDESGRQPSDWALEQNYPNPFNPATTITFSVREQSRVLLTVYTVQGRLVATLADGAFVPGVHRVVFSDEGLASGLYLYRIHANGYSALKKMLLLK